MPRADGRASRSSWRGRLGVLLAVFALASFLVATCARWRHAPGGPALATAVPPRIVLRRGNAAEPESLDLHRARSEPALTILRDLYEGLTAVGSDGATVLAAADACNVSDDGIVYTFHLRAGARWSNGDKLVAADFVAAWRRLLDPHTAAQYSGLLQIVGGAAAIAAGAAPPDTLRVRAPDDATLVVELARPTPYFLGILSHPATFPLHRPSLAAGGRAFAKPGVLVSNGAFALTRWDFGSHLVAARNNYYWNDAATHVDTVEYYSFNDAQTELRAFRTGRLDITSTIPAADLPWVREHLPAAVRIAPQLAVYYLGLNLRKPPFSQSRELRQALSLVIDRDRLVENITAAGEAPAYTFVPPQVRGYEPPQPDYRSWTMARRIARARELLRAAGSPSRIELSYNSGELHNRIAVAVAEMWRQTLGLETTLRAEEFKVLLQDIDRGAVSVFRASWLADFDDPMAFLQVLESRFGINLPHYSNAAYDALLERGAQADGAERRNLLRQAEALMLDDQPLIPLYFYVAKHLVAAMVEGWQPNSMNVAYSKNLVKNPGAAAE